MLFTSRNSIIYIASIIIFSFSACNDDNKLEVNLEGNERDVSIAYFDQAFWQLDSLNFGEGIQEMEKKYPDFFLNNSVSEKDWYTRFQDEKIHNFSDSLFTLFRDSVQYTVELNEGFKRFQYFFEGENLPQIAAWFSNFEMTSAIVSSENTLFIAGEHFLGPEHQFYNGVPEYIRFDKQLAFMSPKVMLEWSNRFNAVDENDQTFLSRIIYEGKRLYFTEQLLNLEDDNRIIAYSKENIRWSEKNEGSIWQFFINNDYLFSNEQKLKRRFIDPSPFSKFYTGNDNATPGRIGTWIGWKIIQSYMEHNPKVSLSALMKEKNAKKILNKSKYKPKI